MRGKTHEINQFTCVLRRLNTAGRVAADLHFSPGESSAEVRLW